MNENMELDFTIEEIEVTELEERLEFDGWCGGCSGGSSNK